jgi:NAD(P)-dependent dehydrogenase (short-subunit alcohol dehydrogenase family)
VHESVFRADVLAGKRILITGGGTGLGRIMASHLAAHGAAVHLWGRRAAVLDEAAAEIGEGAHTPVVNTQDAHTPVVNTPVVNTQVVNTQVVNVRDAEAVEHAMQELWDSHGPLTGVINNAAANFIAPTKDLSPRAYEAVNSTVQDGSYFTTHAAGTRWIAQGLPGHVLSMLTTWIWSGSAFVTPSAMGKAAVHAMTMSLAVEWGPYGIRLNALAPGPFPTDYAWQMLAPTEDVTVGATEAEGVPLGRRHGRPEELGQLVVFLMSDACEYITGAAIPVDGAQRLNGPNTFGGLTALDDDAWTRIRAQASAATEQTRAQRGK